MCLYNGMLSANAPACAAANETAVKAFPPNFDLFCVPSSSIIALSIACWSETSMPTSLLPMMFRMLSTAFVTPLPEYLFPPSLSSCASNEPVDAPDGAIAVIFLPLIVISASTVGFPLESSTSLAHTRSIFIVSPIWLYNIQQRPSVVLRAVCDIVQKQVRSILWLWPEVIAYRKRMKRAMRPG
jgi:hypothetical protein